jgi:histidinol dehydrogenase
MLQRIDLRAGLDDLHSVLPRAATDVASAEGAVSAILSDVQARGAQAVMEATERFDGVRPLSLRVPAELLTAALSGMDPALRAALTESAQRARRGHLAQLPQDVETHITPGGTVTQRWIPVRRVGLYVPGGRAMYPSTVVMNVVPAQVAGVGQIAVTSPAQAENDGWPDRGVLAACALLGVDEVYSAGGAQGIALLGLGSKTDPVVEPVDVLTGPGNIYVTAAKRALRGRVAIDSEAGPTEIAVIADATADPVHVALDLISQAEHDPLACSVLITTSAALADAVDAELARRVPATRHAERLAEALSGKQSGAILVASLDDAVAVADSYAAEHLEVQTADAREVAMRISHAGAIFVGPWSPVSLGDYCAGSNHVLPTAGHARFSSGLNTTTFLRSVQVVEYTEAALAVVTPSLLALSAAENLPAHGEAVAARFDLAPVDLAGGPS